MPMVVVVVYSNTDLGGVGLARACSELPER